MKLSSYSDCEEFLNSFVPANRAAKFPGSHGLERTRHILGLLGNPQDKYKTIHVGGTSGKTSTSTLLAQILTNSGYKTGLFTSPHLQVITERIQINSKFNRRQTLFISEKDLVELLNELGPLFLKLKDDPDWRQPGYFETMTVLAFAYFARVQADVAVIEVGIGGKFDCTNVITPILSIITNVGRDHASILGSTIAAITRDKREIIKPGVPIITGVTQTSVLQLIKEKAKDTKSKLIQIHQNKYKSDYQDLNKEIALAAIKELQAQGYKIEQGVALNTAASFKMPGRLERVSDNPLVILDGAHNPDKMRATVKSLRGEYKSKFNVVYKTLNTQHSARMLEELLPITNKFFITNHDLSYIPTTHYSLHTTLIDAFNSAKQNTLPVLITGSIYTVGEIRNLYYMGEEMVKCQCYFPK